MTTRELPDFPEKPTSEGRDYWRFKDYVGSYDACHGLYLNARADAWEARARLAVDRLSLIEASHACTGRTLADVALNALNDIGPLPDLPSQERTP